MSNTKYASELLNIVTKQLGVKLSVYILGEHSSRCAYTVETCQAKLKANMQLDSIQHIFLDTLAYQLCRGARGIKVLEGLYHKTAALKQSNINLEVFKAYVSSSFGQQDIDTIIDTLSVFLEVSPIFISNTNMNTYMFQRLRSIFYTCHDKVLVGALISAASPKPAEYKEGVLTSAEYTEGDFLLSIKNLEVMVENRKDQTIHRSFVKSSVMSECDNEITPPGGKLDMSSESEGEDPNFI
jgi:hypothetical protein